MCYNKKRRNKEGFLEIQVDYYEKDYNIEGSSKGEAVIYRGGSFYLTAGESRPRRISNYRIESAGTYETQD